MLRLILKTATLMHAFDESVPADLADKVRIRFRHAFFAGGYAHSDSQIDEAISIAKEQLGLDLEATYTGKAMAALLYDLASARPGAEYLFWNT
jgi:1-aminocyclopropane-1-carboxylate deaminase/D-cysteine desulfhydrase-like pyridoxal-dependent ACC family enzyme